MTNRAQAVIDRFDEISTQAARNCGCSYEVYVRRVSEMVDDEVSRLTEQDQAIVLAAAAERLDYATPSELAAQEEELREEGYCVHGLDEMTCPCGCFEANEFPAEFLYDANDQEIEEPEFTLQALVDKRAIEAQIDICEMVIAALQPLVEDCPEAQSRLCDTYERFTKYSDEL